ncbi:MAG TPA: CNNM domain-containing protein [Pirellulaceae bacterium]|nr:CNNM domain-containing protein [Pirellulaceae bacterium]
MTALLGLSALLSGSEAALFSLRPLDRRQLAQGAPTQRVAARLLNQPERLLSGILFWNLLVNLMYFSLSSMAALMMERLDHWNAWQASMFAFASLIILIFFGEVLPKTIAVIAPISLSAWSSLPLTLLLRIVDRVMPGLRRINRVSQRVLWPTFQPEPYLETADLERAIRLSSSDEAIVKQEQAVLHNIVELSAIRVDEWMRPRTQFKVFQPPVHLADLKGVFPAGGHLLIAEPHTQEIARAVRLTDVYTLPDRHLERLAERVSYLPWCATVADAFEQMAQGVSTVTAIVNEYGETIGVLTVEDILETVFTYAPSRSKRLLDRNPLHPLEPGRWLVAGMMSLRQLARRLNVAIPRTHSVTVAGVIQESMQRLAQTGDQCTWGPFHFRVVEVGERGNLVVELTLQDREGGD